jgi:hypothetical protein
MGMVMQARQRAAGLSLTAITVAAIRVASQAPSRSRSSTHFSLSPLGKVVERVAPYCSTHSVEFAFDGLIVTHPLELMQAAGELTDAR